MYSSGLDQVTCICSYVLMFMFSCSDVFYPPVPLLRSFLYIPSLSLITYCGLLMNLEKFQVMELKSICYKLVSLSDQGAAIHG